MLAGRLAQVCGIAGFALAGGCTAIEGSSERVDVTEANDLGVTALEVERSVVGSDQVFELHGLDARGDLRASVRLRTGSIPELVEMFSGNDTFGSEIRVWAGGPETWVKTREVDHLALAPLNDLAAQQFVELASVSSALERERIFVTTRSAGQGEETAFTSACAAGDMLTTPTAFQCCLGGTTVHVLKSQSPDAEVRRTKNPYQTGCKASNGTGSCSGASCYYGPNGFARPVVTYGNVFVPKARIESSGEPFGSCSAHWYYTLPSPLYYPDVTGTFPRNQGCPGGGTGAGQWDY